MEKITSINRDRLEWSLRESGVDIPQLASSVHISEQTLTNIMEGHGALTFVQLQKLARYFNRGVLFFIEPGIPDEIHYDSTQFRTLANQKPQLTPQIRSLIQRVEYQRRIYVDLLAELGEPQIELFDSPEIPENNPPLAASIIRRWLGLIDKNTFDS